MESLIDANESEIPEILKENVKKGCYQSKGNSLKVYL